MASLFNRAAITASRSGRIVQKRFGSHAHHPTGPEAPPTQEGFTSGGFKLALTAVVGLIAWSRIDEHLTNQGEEKHPITRYIEYYMRSEKESARLNEQHIVLAQQAAEERKFYSAAALPPKVQLRYPDLMSNASGKCIQVGSNVSTEGVAPKFH
ncbi:hypothetical protein BGZ74_001907 [Mortierella antarctica]|nr:hypothetical protein BGZ74_001907 [Mortierella antarctica]